MRAALPKHEDACRHAGVGKQARRKLDDGVDGVLFEKVAPDGTLGIAPAQRSGEHDERRHAAERQTMVGMQDERKIGRVLRREGACAGEACVGSFPVGDLPASGLPVGGLPALEKAAIQSPCLHFGGQLPQALHKKRTIALGKRARLGNACQFISRSFGRANLPQNAGDSLQRAPCSVEKRSLARSSASVERHCANAQPDCPEHNLSISASQASISGIPSSWR